MKRVVVLLLLCLSVQVAEARRRREATYEATAYSDRGTTASGVQTQRHIVAADPAVLPFGSLIRIRNAGRYSGKYVVADTGRKIAGRKLDIFIPNEAEAKRFGRRNVRVLVLKKG